MFFGGADFAVSRGWSYPRSFSPATMVSGQKLNTEAISPAMQKPQSEQPLQPHKKSISKRTTYSIYNEKNVIIACDFVSEIVLNSTVVIADIVWKNEVRMQSPNPSE